MLNYLLVWGSSEVYKLFEYLQMQAERPTELFIEHFFALDPDETESYFPNSSSRLGHWVSLGVSDEKDVIGNALNL